MYLHNHLVMIMLIWLLFSGDIERIHNLQVLVHYNNWIYLIWQLMMMIVER